MHLVQIVDEPQQIVALELRYTLPILFQIEYVGEFIVKPGRGFVEVVELL